MSGDICILTKTQLSKNYLDGLQRRYGADVVVKNFSELQSSKLLTQWRNLQRLAPALLVLPAEDENSLCVLPIMKLIASATRAKRVVAVDSNYAESHISKWACFSAICSLGNATLLAALQTLNANREMKRLRREERVAMQSVRIRRVLYINANLWFGVKAGGSVGHISGVINALLRKRIRVDFASVGTRLMVREEANYIALSPPKAFGVPFEINYYRFSRSVARVLGRSRDGYPYDAIYQRLSLGNYSGAVLARKMKIPLITEYNGSEAWVARNWGKPLRLDRLAVLAEDVMLRHSDLIVTVSNVLADELISRGVPRRRIVSYPNCIDPELFDPAKYPRDRCIALRKQIDVPVDAVLATFIGTFGQWHGTEVLAAAIAELIREDAAWLREHRVMFLLVGDGVKMPVVKEILAGVDSESHCRILGLVPQSEAPAYLAASDLLLSPHVENADGSKFFGSPTKLFEYMAMGKAIVASRLDQIAHVLDGSLDAASLPIRTLEENSEAVGVLCEPGSVQQLVDGIRFCVEHPSVRLKLGANARARALTRYTWQHHVDAIMQGLGRVYSKDEPG